MGVDAVGHAADDGVLVGLLGKQREQFAYADTVHIGRDGLVERPAVVVPGFGLRIKGVQMRRAAPHPNLDDRLGLRLFGRSLGPEGRLAEQCQACGAEEAPLQ